MRSVFTSAVLATAFAGQALARGSSLRHAHNHQHLHEKKAEAKRNEVTAVIDGQTVSWENNYFGASSSSTEAAAEPTTVVAVTSTSSVAAASSAAASSSKKSSATSTSSAAAASSSVTTKTDATDLESVLTELLSANGVTKSTGTSGVTNDDSQAYVFDVTNNSEEDVVLVLWTAADGEEDWSAECVQTYTPALTVAIACGGSTQFSMSGESSTSGAFSLLSSASSMTDSFIANTWVEFTVYQDDSTYGVASSVVDVSKILGDGNGFSVKTYPTKGGDEACLTDMDTCVYTATNTISNCTYGETGNTVNEEMTAGGCDFLSKTGGYAAVTITY